MKNLKHLRSKSNEQGQRKKQSQKLKSKIIKLNNIIITKTFEASKFDPFKYTYYPKHKP